MHFKGTVRNRKRGRKMKKYIGALLLLVLVLAGMGDREALKL